jgi:hypothetical protein
MKMPDVMRLQLPFFVGERGASVSSGEPLAARDLD